MRLLNSFEAASLLVSLLSVTSTAAYDSVQAATSVKADQPRLGVASRAITETEQLLHGIEGADAIVVATVISVDEELIEDETEKRSVLVAYSRIRLDELPMGSDASAKRGATQAIVIPNERMQLFQQHQRSGTPMLLFLRNLQPPRTARTHAHGALEFRFKNVWMAYVPGEGAFPLASSQVGATARRIEDACTLSKPLNLLRLADVVIRGHHEGQPSICEGDGRPQICANIVVDEALYGEVPGQSLAVYTAVPGYVRTEECVYFLKRMPEGSFEVIGLGGGIRVVRGDSLGRRGDDLNAVRRSMAAADSVRKGTSGRP